MWNQGTVEAPAADPGGDHAVLGTDLPGRRDATSRPRFESGTATAIAGEIVTAFSRTGGVLHAESVPLTAIAERFGTPCYVYSRAAIEDGYRTFDAAFSGTRHLVCYAIKANSNLAVLNLLGRLGCGFDIVSGGELERVIAAGGDPGRIVFSGVGKTATEMEAALSAKIRCFNVESAAELEVLNAVAGTIGRVAPISLRVNPDVDPKTHPYIATGLKESKFGVAVADAPALYRRAARLPHIDVQGIDCHIGSQVTDVSVYVEAAQKMFDLVDRIERDGIPLQHVDVGGGLGIRYRDEQTIDARGYARAIRDALGERRHELLFEPGRFLVGEAGVLLTRVLYLKPGATHDFAIVDAAMNDFIRPALYDAWHPVEPVSLRDGPARRWQIVGPVCESSDFLAHDRDLVLAAGDLLALRAAGAYGFVMSSNYNSRPRASEIVVDGDRAHLVRPRERAADLFAGETMLP